MPWGRLLEGRITLRDRDVRVHGLYENRFSPRAQAKLAEHLAAALDVERDPLIVVDAPLPPPSNPRFSRIFGAMVIVFLLMSLGALLGWKKTREQLAAHGWLELECTSTCRIQGLTCLEGGELSFAFETDEIIVEVADLEAVGGFRPVVVPIRAGRTHFECRSDAQPPPSAPLE